MAAGAYGIFRFYLAMRVMAGEAFELRHGRTGREVLLDLLMALDAPLPCGYYPVPLRALAHTEDMAVDAKKPLHTRGVHFLAFVAPDAGVRVAGEVVGDERMAVKAFQEVVTEVAVAFHVFLLTLGLLLPVAAGA